MAVVNAYQESNLAAGKKANPAKSYGGKLLTLEFNFETLAADDDGSVYRLGVLPANAIPVKCEIFSDAQTSMNDVDLGLYIVKDGAVVDKDIFADALDLSSGAAITAGKNGLTNLGGADPVAAVGKKLYELLGLTESTKTRESYDLALTANTATSAAGTISGYFQYILG